MELSEKQWEKIFEILDKYRKEPAKTGRPRQNDHHIFKGICWILKTGARWKDLPKDYPSYQTCHRRFQEWVKEGVLVKILQEIAITLEEEEMINLAECFIDATFSPAKKGDLKLGKQRKAKVQKSWQYLMLKACQYQFSSKVRLHAK